LFLPSKTFSISCGDNSENKYSYSSFELEEFDDLGDDSTIEAEEEALLTTWLDATLAYNLFYFFLSLFLAALLLLDPKTYLSIICYLSII